MDRSRIRSDRLAGSFEVASSTTGDSEEGLEQEEEDVEGGGELAIVVEEVIGSMNK